MDMYFFLALIAGVAAMVGMAMTARILGVQAATRHAIPRRRKIVRLLEFIRFQHTILIRIVVIEYHPGLSGLRNDLVVSLSESLTGKSERDCDQDEQLFHSCYPYGSDSTPHTHGKSDLGPWRCNKLPSTPEPALM